MKRRFLMTPIYLAVVLAVLAQACAPATPAKRVAQGLETIAVTVKASMNTFGILYRAGKVSEPQKEYVLQSYAKYQTAMALAEQALRLLPPNTDPPDLETPVREAASVVTSMVGLLEAK